MGINSWECEHGIATILLIVLLHMLSSEVLQHYFNDEVCYCCYCRFSNTFVNRTYSSIRPAATLI